MGPHRLHHGNNYQKKKFKKKFERYGNRTRVLSLEGSYVTTTSTVQLMSCYTTAVTVAFGKLRHCYIQQVQVNNCILLLDTTVLLSVNKWFFFNFYFKLNHLFYFFYSIKPVIQQMNCLISFFAFSIDGLLVGFFLQ